VDVFVGVHAEDNLVGVAVDRVRAVVGEEELGAGGAAGDELPSYVVEVLRGKNGPVFLVDLPQMVDAARKAAAL